MKQLRPKQVIDFKSDLKKPYVSLYINRYSDLRDQVDEAKSLLLMSSKRYRKELLAKLDLMEAQMSKEDPYPLALFVSPQLSGFLTLPFQLQSLAVVASSFHVKPLLKWMQREQPFLMAQFTSRGVRLYEGSLNHFTQTENIALNNFECDLPQVQFVDRMIKQNENYKNIPLIIFGENFLCESYQSQSERKNIIEAQVIETEDYNDLHTLHKCAIQVLEPYLIRREQIFVNAYWSADLKKQTTSKLNEIIYFVLQNQVKHLFINEDLHIWGQIDHQSGQFTYSPHQLNAEDDDILDDLAEIVIRNGGLVTVLNKQQMPERNAACAILTDSVRRKFMHKEYIETEARY